MRFRFSSAWLPLVVAIGMADASAQTPATRTEPAGKTAQDQQKDRTPAKAITDGWITLKVHSMFVPEDALEGSNIDVDTRSGVVTLSGTVATEAGRRRAVEITRTTEGVKSVDDKALRVAPAATGTAGQASDAGKRAGRSVNDGWTKSKIYSQFLTEDTLNDSDIDVAVTNGLVTLSGTARTPAGVARAEAIAKATEGVKGVKNNIKATAR
jgi:hyperosmotically inducible periplasmic protein